MEGQIEKEFCTFEDVEKLFNKSINDLKIPDLNKLKRSSRTIFVEKGNNCSYSCPYLQENIEEDIYYCIEDGSKIRLRNNIDGCILDYPSHIWNMQIRCKRSSKCISTYGL